MTDNQTPAALDFLEKGSKLMLAVTTAGFILNFLFNLLLSRLLSVQDYGDFKVANSFVNLCQVAVLLGGAAAALRFLPDYLSGKDRGAVWEYVRFYLLIMLGLSFVVIVVVAFASYLQNGPLDLEHHHPLAYAVLVVPVAGAVALMRKAAQAARDLWLAFVPYSIGYPVVAMGLVGLLYTVTGGLTDVYAVFVIFVANLTILGFIWWQLHRRELMPIRRAEHVAKPKEWLKASTPMMFILSLQTLIVQTDVYMLEMLGDENEVGLFAACSTIAVVLSIVQGTVAAVLTPLMSETARMGKAEVAALNRKGRRQLLLFGLPLTVLVVVFGQQILGWFGPGYVQAAPVMYILLGAYFIQTALMLPGLWLRYCGYANQVLVVLLGEALLMILLNLWLIPRYGYLGAAISTATAYLIGLSAIAILMRRLMGVWAWSFRAMRPL